MNINYFGCDRFPGGYYTTNISEAKPFQFCNVTAVYGANATDSEIKSARILNYFLATFYFVTFILISAFVMLSLFIGAITMSMTQSMEQMKAAQEEAERKERLEKARKRTLEAQRREREKAQREEAERIANGGEPVKQEEKLSAAERRDRQKMREVLLQTWDEVDLTDMLTMNQGDNNSLRGRYLLLAARCTKIVEHPRFSGFITLVICMAGLMVGLQTSTALTNSIGDVLDAIDSIILAVFTTEVVLKLVAEGLEPWLYFRSGWNTFDFIIVIGSFLPGQGGMLTMLRLLRLLRVLKLVRAFPQLQVIVSALMKGVSSIGYIGLILLLCFYVFGIVGNMLFADNDPFHFKNLHYAMISLFHCATMDGWSDVLYINYYGCDEYGYDDYEALGYKCKPGGMGFIAVAYFSSFIVLGAMVLITLFIGVVTTSMEEATQEMEAEKALLRRIEELRVRKQVDQAVVDSYMQVFRMLDLDGSGSVEEAELRIGLAAIGKYPSYEELKEMMDVVDEDGSGQIDIVEFVEFMIHVREKSAEQKKKALETVNEEAAALDHDVEATDTAAVGATHDSSRSDLTRGRHGGTDRIQAVTATDGMGDETRETVAVVGAVPPITAFASERGSPPPSQRTATSVDGKVYSFHVPIGDQAKQTSTTSLSAVTDAQLVESVDVGKSTSSPQSTPVSSPRMLSGMRSATKYKIVPSG
ncbi:hypothetical protein PINS_up001206 [Pythium insidiosum]|nr:hypothetical protein PINS_up001206 [Pythium insidiosum]